MVQMYEQEPQPTYQPTQEQRARQKALSWFNRRFVYLPLLLAILFTSGLIALLTWQAAVAPLLQIESSADYARGIVSGLADAIFVLLSIPLLLCSLLFPLAILSAFFYGRREGFVPLTRLQRLAWRFESMLMQVGRLVSRSSEKVARVTIEVNRNIARIDAGLGRLLPFEPTHRSKERRTSHDE